MKVVECRGGARARGEQTGEALRDAIAANLAHVKRPNDEAWRRRLPVILDTVRRYMPDLLDEMDGMAAGANLPVDNIYALNFKLWDDSLDWDGCTNLVFSNGPDGPIWGKNNDGNCGAPMREAAVRVVYPEHGIPQAAMINAGWLSAADGINAEGLAVGHSSVGSIFQQSDRHPMFRLWDYKMRSECRSVAEYIRRMSDLPLHDKGYSLVCTDASGAYLSIEAACPLLQVRQPDQANGVFCVNCYLLPQLRDADRRQPGAKEDAMRRAVYLRGILDGPGPFDVDHMKRVLRNHDDQAVCRHDERLGEPVTNFSCIGLPATRKLLFLGGQPCQSEYQEVTL